MRINNGGGALGWYFVFFNARKWRVLGLGRKNEAARVLSRAKDATMLRASIRIFVRMRKKKKWVLLGT